MTAPLPMGGQKITGMADPTLSTDGATKNYVDSKTSAFFSTGDIKLTLKVTADPSWVMFDDGTIGSASSGATTLAQADTQALFILLFNLVIDAWCPIFTSGGGATTRAAQSNAASAWAANCRMSLPKTLGRALAIAGTGSGLSGHALAMFNGEETHTLTANETAPHTHTGTTGSESATHTHTYNDAVSKVVTAGSGGGVGNLWSGNTTVSTSTESASHTHSITTNSGDSVNGAAHNNVQPSVYLNAMVKL